MNSGTSGAIRRIAFAALTLAAVAGEAAQAQDYPARPITIVVPFPAGGTSDIVPRILQEGLMATLGQPIVVENRSGASGTPGSLSVARAQPDGYTILAALTPTHSMNMYLQKNFPYDPVKSFEPIILIGSSPLFLAVHPSLPVKTVRELVDYARANPGKLVFGSAGPGTGQHIMGELIKKRENVNMVHLPYRGTGPMMADFLTGQFMVGFGTATGIMPLAESGKLRLLAVAEPKRLSYLPDLPVINETIANMDFFSWYGMFAPANTPRPIIDKLNAAIQKELQSPRVIAKMKEQAVDLLGGPPERLTDVLKKDIAKWGVDIPAIGIEPQ